MDGHVLRLKLPKKSIILAVVLYTPAVFEYTNCYFFAVEARHERSMNLLYLFPIEFMNVSCSEETCKSPKRRFDQMQEKKNYLLLSIILA